MWMQSRRRHLDAIALLSDKEGSWASHSILLTSLSDDEDLRPGVL